MFQEILDKHAALSHRQKESITQIERIREAFKNETLFLDNQTQIFCAGSLGREDKGVKSDMDIFVVSDLPRNERRRLCDLEMLARLIDLNNELGFPEFSNDGLYLKVQPIDEMLEQLGAPQDDSQNLFTTRMLMLLESKPILNDAVYYDHISRAIEHYFRDRVGHAKFQPMFLLNDLLRYWRTLCLNYEKIRNSPDRKWRKKNINLKFSRPLTVFATVLPLIATPVTTAQEVVELTRMPPLHRLTKGLEVIADRALVTEFETFLNDYEAFLSWKEDPDIEAKMKQPEDKKKAQDAAQRFSNFLYRALMHERIPADLRRYLVV